MINFLSRALDWASDFFAARKGLLPLIGIGMIGLNFLIQLISSGWFAETDFFLHLGVIISILGLMIARAL